MEELDIATITKRSIRGVFALVSRTFFIGIFNVAVNILLTIYLSPSIFGVYFLVTAVIAFLQYFSDIGLAAALIQKKEKLTDVDLSSTFIIQQGLVVIAVVIAFILSPFITEFYHFTKIEEYLLQALIISFFFSSLKTIPSVLLERDLRFEKLVIPQIVETFVFGITAVVLAVMHFGVESFTYAVLARGICGLIAIYIIMPWKPGFAFSKENAKKLLSFGIPFQTNSFLSLLKDDLFLAYVGKVLPIAQVGYIGFAQKWAYMPLRLVMDNVVRISFSSFSRLAHNPAGLRKAVEKMLFASCVLIFPCLMGLVILAPDFIHFVPKYQKWDPTLLSIGFFAINAALSAISTPLTNVLNAIGKVKVSLYLMVFWTIAQWVVTPIMIFYFGFNGVSIGSAIIAVSVVLVVYIVKKHVQFSMKEVIILPTVATCVMGILVLVASPFLATNLFGVFGLVIIGACCYFGVLLLIGGSKIRSDFNVLMAHIKP